MSRSPLPELTAAEAAGLAPGDPDAGFGCLRTDRGNLPLRALAVRTAITGLTSRTVLTQRFVNPYAEPIEATYVFPLPDRGAVTDLRFTAADHTVVARLAERGEARQAYDDAIAAGRRAAIAEEERPDVFTLRVGNLLAGEEVTVELTVVGVLVVADGAATFRFPLVVAPRYVPGMPLPGDAVGSGWQPDTDAVPDASRISPPVLLPGFPYPVTVDIAVDVDPAGLPFGTPRSSLHAVTTDGGTIRFAPGGRADRDVVLRFPLVEGEGGPAAALTLAPDVGVAGAGGGEGTFELTVLPPATSGARPRDVVLLLDRSGSMGGWKMVAARRAAARIVDTLTDADRFAVLAFDHLVSTPPSLGGALVAGTDRHRFRAVEFLAGLEARGGTELSEPLSRAERLLVPVEGRDAVLVLVTDGQVGNEDQLLRAHAAVLSRTRVHTVGVDQAVNAGFLGRLASVGGGRCELVESEDRLDEAMTQIHRRISSPVVRDVRLEVAGLDLDPGTVTPARLPDVFAGVPYVVRGRYRSAADARATLRGDRPDGSAWSVEANGGVREAPAVGPVWARARVRDLEDRYVSGLDRFTIEPGGDDRDAELEREIVAVSLRFGVLSRFTAYVAVDERVVTDGTAPRQVVQPVDLPAAWQAPDPAAPVAAYRMRFATNAAPRPDPGVMPSGPTGFAPFARRPQRGVAPMAAAAPMASCGPASGVGEQGSVPDHAAETADLLLLEAARLDALAGTAAHEVREGLLDLASRLAVLDVPLVLPADRWHRLLDRLAARAVGESADPAALAGQVAAELRELAASLAPAARRAGAAARVPFWKRRPSP